jgi:hypothetical protein
MELQAHGIGGEGVHLIAPLPSLIHCSAVPCCVAIMSGMQSGSIDFVITEQHCRTASLRLQEPQDLAA